MTNRFRNEIIEEKEIIPVKEEQVEAPKAEVPKNFFTILFTEGVVSKEAATEMLPFILFAAFLGMIYIGNKHFAENNIRSIDKLQKEVLELSANYKVLKAELMLKSTKTEVARQVDSLSLGLIEPVEPPKKIIVPANEYQN
ncbi:MAG: FtsL-like putative cell division protein [Sphingobacteriaceae bacterium]